MSKAKIIGICGYARSGKDTAAQALLGDGWVRAALADALKRDVETALRSSMISCHRNPPDQPDWFTDRKEEFRPLLVEYGRAMRSIDPDYWVKRLAFDLSPESCYAITDVRYANEAEWVRSQGGIVVEIVRPGIGPANKEEAASMEAFKPDIKIDNGGTVEELHSRMKAAAKELA